MTHTPKLAIDRRTALTLLAAGAIAAPGSAWAKSETTAERARRLFARATVINGNLVAPFDPDGPLDAPTAAMVKAAGIAAFKQTLGGSGSQSRAETLEEIAMLDKAIAASPGVFVKVGSLADIAQAKRTGRTGVIYSFEAGEMLEGKVEAIDDFSARGVRVMGLSYNLNTPFASGLMSKAPTGLTDLGREAVARMNANGVTLDVSHSDERSSLGAIAASRQPVLITHTGCAAINPNPRNKSDALLRAIADKGGVVGIFELSYLTPPPAAPTLEVYLAHLEHALKVCGEDHVGIGSDALLTPFDTSPESMAAWDKETARRKATGVAAPGEGPPPFVVGLNRPDRLTVVAEALLARGHRERVVEKVLGANFLRVFAETWPQPAAAGSRNL